MLWLQETVRSQAWTDQAVRDTIADIAKAPDYQRKLADTLWSKSLDWVVRQIQSLIDFARDTSYGRIAVTVLVLLAVVLVIARVVIGIRAERLHARIVGPKNVGAGRGIQISDAERLAAAGDYTAAAHALFDALLSAGAARGEFRIHPSKTTGDYAAELRRRRAGWLRPFQSFRVRYDRVIYGDMQCSAEDYRALETDVRQMMTVA